MGLFDIFKKTKVDKKTDPYLNIVLPNGNTIREQQEIDIKHAEGKFEDSVPVFLGMHILPNSVPATENYATLNADEKKFLTEFQKLLIQNKYDPQKISLRRLANGTFNVNYASLCYIGKFCLFTPLAKYSVKKQKNKRATKTFDSLYEAEEFAKTNEEYEIIPIETHQERYMQYFIGMKQHELFDASLEEMINALPRWIKYLNYCKRN